MITYYFPEFTLEYSAPDITTTYKDGTSCRVWTNEEDIKHGAAIGISGDQHKILHELSHSMIAIAQGQKVCPIAWAEAHRKPMPDNAKFTEDLIMAISYLSMGASMPEPYWWALLGEVQKFCNPNRLANEILLLFAGVDLPSRNIKVIEQ